MPGAGHAQVGVQDAAVAEREQQVLAARLHRLEHAGRRAPPRARTATGSRAPARGHSLAGERRHAPRRDLERVALGQAQRLARSVRRRGPATKPAAVKRPPTGAPAAASPSMRSSCSAPDPALERRRRERLGDGRPVGRLERLQREQRARRRARRTRAARRCAARRARRRRARRGRRPAPASAARCRRGSPDRSRRARCAGGVRRRVAHLAQALDRAGQGVLRPAEAVDEVAAPRDAERLELAERAAQARRAARNALGDDGGAHEHAVALEQQLGERAAAVGLVDRGREQRSRWAPSARARPRAAAGAGASAGACRARGVSVRGAAARRVLRSGSQASFVASPEATRRHSASMTSALAAGPSRPTSSARCRAPSSAARTASEAGSAGGGACPGGGPSSAASSRKAIATRPASAPSHTSSPLVQSWSSSSGR